MAQTNLEVIISARDQFSGTANRVIGKLGQMQTAAGRVGRGMGQVAGGVARLGVAVGVAAGTGFALAAREAFKYEDSIAGVAKTTDLTTEEVKTLSRDLRDMAMTIPIGVNELAGLAEIAGALGINGLDNIKEFTRVTALLGETTNLSAADAATALGQISTILGLTIDEYENFGATLVDLGNKGASTESDIIEITRRAAGAAKNIGLSTSELLGFSAAFANIAGGQLEAAGTAVQRFFLEAQAHVADNGDQLRVWADTAGVSAAAFRKAFGDDPESALSSFVRGLGRLGGEERLKVLEQLGLDDVRIRQFLLNLAESEKETGNLTKALETSEEAWIRELALSEEAAKRFATTASKLKLLQGAVIEAALTFAGDPNDPTTLAGSIGVVAEKLRTFILDPSNKKAIEDFGRSVGRAISSIDFDELLATAKSLATTFRNDLLPILRAAFDAFNALPGPIKGIAASLAILSQTPVVGGALKDILGGLGNIGGGILGGVGSAVGRTAVGKLFAQPVFVTNWPPGAFTGGLGGGAAGAAGSGRALLGALGIGGLLAVASHLFTERFNEELRNTGNDVQFSAPGGGPFGIFSSVDNLTKAIQAWQAGGFKVTPVQPLTVPAPPIANQVRDREPSKMPVKPIVDQVRDSNSGTQTVLERVGDRDRQNVRSVIDRLGTRDVGNTSRVVSAINSIAAPIVNVNVQVSGTAVTKTTTTQNRYGPPVGSQYRPQNAPGQIAL